MTGSKKHERGTGAFAASCLCRRPRTLRLVQAAAALLRVAYGSLIHVAPVIVASALGDRACRRLLRSVSLLE